MKISGFIKEFSNLSGKAKQRMRRWLKKTKGPYCPITQVVKAKLNQKYEVGEFEDAAIKLNISDRMANDIVAAADANDMDSIDQLSRTQRKYRKLMLEAVNG